tara:strand:- start:10362 stop:10562 length:201 start_codon:yes stop_codon:yes gene_type:complete
MEEEKKDIVLSEEEKQFIESQRNSERDLELFKKEYADLVNLRGFAWAVDGNAPINNPKLAIGRVQR